MCETEAIIIRHQRTSRTIWLLKLFSGTESCSLLNTLNYKGNQGLLIPFLMVLHFT